MIAAAARELLLAGAALAWRLRPPPPTRPLAVLGLEFAAPIGLAAGVDRHGRLIGRLHGSGFGFAEVGTVFGRAAAVDVAARLYRRGADPTPLAVSIGSPGDAFSAAAADEIVALAGLLAPAVDLVVVNASSSRNAATAAGDSELRRLLDRCRAAAGGRPLLVKLRLDPAAGLPARLAAAAGVDGLVAAMPADTGAEAARRCLERLCRSVGPLPVVAVGGVRGAADLRARLDGGAALVQVCGAVLRGGIMIARRLPAEPTP